MLTLRTGLQPSPKAIVPAWTANADCLESSLMSIRSGCCIPPFFAWHANHCLFLCHSMLATWTVLEPSKNKRLHTCKRNTKRVRLRHVGSNGHCGLACSTADAGITPVTTTCLANVAMRTMAAFGLSASCLKLSCFTSGADFVCPKPGGKSSCRTVGTSVRTSLQWCWCLAWATKDPFDTVNTAVSNSCLLSSLLLRNRRCLSLGDTAPAFFE